MGMHATAKVYKVPGRKKPWMVRWRVPGKADPRRYFAVKQQAQIFCDKLNVELENYGAKHSEITEEERLALMSFRDAVAKMPEPRPSLRDCVNSYLATIANQLTPVTVAELVSLRLKAAESKGVHARTLRDLGGANGKGGRLGAFAAVFGERLAAGITPDEIEQWAEAHCGTDSNRREVLVRLNGLFAFGVKRGFVRENPVGKLDKPRSNAPEADFLTIRETAALLSACPPEALPAVAVQLFAGVRKSEAERMNWEHVDFERGVVRVIQRKGTGSRREIIRMVPLLPALRAWLEPRRKLSGPVFPVASRGPRKGEMSGQVYRVAFERARELAGIEAWDENTLRHTFGTYRHAAIQNLPQLMAEMGHKEADTTVNHYVNAASAADAEAFWGIVPDGGRDEKVVSITRHTA